MKNQKLTSEEFVERVDALFAKIKKQNPDYKDIRLRKGKIKDVIEELLPLKDFVKEIEKEKGPISIIYHGKDSIWDATLEIGKDKFGVQVTIATEDKEYLRRQAMVEGAPVFFGEIHRDKKTGKIISTPRVFSGDEHIRENAQIIELAINRKKQFNYGKNCILLVSVEEYDFILDDEWQEVKLMINKDDVPFESIWLRRKNGQCEKI